LIYNITCVKMPIWSIELIILMVICRPAKIFWISVSECLKIIYFVMAQLSERSKFRSLNPKNFRSKRPNWALKNGAFYTWEMLQKKYLTALSMLHFAFVTLWFTLWCEMWNIYYVCLNFKPVLMNIISLFYLFNSNLNIINF